MAARLHPAFVATGALVCLILLFSMRGSFVSLYKPAVWNGAETSITTTNHSLYDISKTTTEIGRASNATLGFEKVIVLGLKARSDRRDAMVLQSSVTGFHVDFEDGVNGSEIIDKALPPGFDIHGKSYIGSWRGHLNAIRRVLQEPLSSALILEDDLDWDLRLRAQLQDFARGVRHLQNIAEGQHQRSPYGDDWDVLWLGHCGEVLPEDDERRYVINNDETVAPKEHQPWLLALKEYPENTRIVHKTGAPICSFGYAVSPRGAQKILNGLGLHYGSLSFDTALAYSCRDNYLGLKCYSVQPMLFYHHRPAGSVAKDTDMSVVDKPAVREKGFTENIVWSTRLNLEKLILGTTDYVMQW